MLTEEYMKKDIYTIQYFLSLIPFVGLLIILFSCLIKTGRKRPSLAFKWYFFSLIPIIVGFALIVLALKLLNTLPEATFIALILLVTYLLCVAIAVAMVFIEKKILRKFEQTEYISTAPETLDEIK